MTAMDKDSLKMRDRALDRKYSQRMYMGNAKG